MINLTGYLERYVLVVNLSSRGKGKMQGMVS